MKLKSLHLTNILNGVRLLTCSACWGVYIIFWRNEYVNIGVAHSSPLCSDTLCIFTIFQMAVSGWKPYWQEFPPWNTCPGWSQSSIWPLPATCFLISYRNSIKASTLVEILVKGWTDYYKINLFPQKEKQKTDN